LKPRALFGDPFRKGPHKLVLCDTYTPLGEPLSNNHRHWATELFERKCEEEPWFGLEQEYFLLDPVTLLPLGYDERRHKVPIIAAWAQRMRLDDTLPILICGCAWRRV